jgi:hypothetical protein
LRKILKYSLDGLGTSFIRAWYELTPLHVGWQNGLKIWAEAKESEIPINYIFDVYGTGWDLPEDDFTSIYCGTVQGTDGYVYHVYKRQG